LEDRLQDITKVHEREIKRRKLAERVANNYYKEWKAEREAKDKALEKQVFKPTFHLPDSFYIKNELLNFESNTSNIIGSGVFGTVKLCQYKGSCVAVKCLKTSTEESVHIQKEASLKAIIREAKVMLSLKSHESIPTFLGVSVDKEPYKIVMQFYAIQGQSISLLSLCKCDDKLMLSEEQHLAYSVIPPTKAIVHVHNCGYLHNDIKTDNVVIYENNCQFFPVLIDFRKSCKREQGSVKLMKTEEQSVYQKRYKHIAPEIVNGSHKQSIYSDIYSFGYLVYNMYKTMQQCRRHLLSL
jgi:serine/threonine protein kinase